MMDERKKRLRKYSTLDRDRRWHDLWKGGMTQAEIAEDNDTNASYVCQRIKKHRERIESGANPGDSYDVQASALLIIETDKQELERLLENFIIEAGLDDEFDIADLHLKLRMITSQFHRPVLRSVDKDLLYRAHIGIARRAKGYGFMKPDHEVMRG